MAEHEERYRTLVELAPDAIFVHRDGRFVFGNVAGLRMIGASTLEELVGQPVIQFASSSYQDRARDRLREVAQQGTPQPLMEMDLVRIDGVTIRAQVATVRVMYEGTPALLTFVRDITDHVRAREELERTVSLQRATLESTADGILVVDTEGRIVSYNRKFTTMWRIPEQILTSGDDRAAIKFVLDQLVDPSQFLAKVQALYEQRDATSFDVLTFKDGRTFERFSQPQRLGERIVGRVWSFRDVTDRQRLAQRIAQLEKMDAVARFASGIAHDFNNLLTIVQSYADLLMHQFRPDEAGVADVQQIKRAAERAAALARQLLLFARRAPQAPKRLRVNSFLEDAKPILERFLRPAVSLTYHLRSDLPDILADTDELERVMINLVKNAVEAIHDAGSITIRTEIANLDPAAATAVNVTPGTFVAILVNDTGEGMSTEALAHAFEPFFTTKPVGEGSGLGLTTVFSLVRQAGGHIDVESGPKGGTTFRILLPAA